MTHTMGFVHSQVYPEGTAWPNTRQGAIDCLNYDCETSVPADQATVIRDTNDAWLVICRVSGISFRVWPMIGQWEEVDGDDLATYYGFGYEEVR